MSSNEVYVGVDLGGTTVTGIAATAAGEVLAQEQRLTAAHEGREAVLRCIAELVRELAEAAERPIQRLAMGCPGAVDVASGSVRWMPNFPREWCDFPLAARLGDRLDMPVHLLNDVRMAGLGELAFGYARGREKPTFAVVTLGTGVGGAVVVDGKLRLGLSGAAGEIGHIPVASPGSRCGCGQRGCLETVASMPALVGEATRRALSGHSPSLRQMLEAGGGRLTTHHVARAIAEGDEAALDLLEEYSRWLARGLVCLVLALAPDALVLAGGGAGLGEPLRQRCAEHLQNMNSMTPAAELRVVLSQLGERSGCLGAVALAAAAGNPAAVRASCHRTAAKGSAG